ncbi:MAG TPA: alkaline phosphatase family protein [Methanocella sp.]|nr:alkaline phosphatase family protein [Methanocella sp.]
MRMKKQIIVVLLILMAMMAISGCVSAGSKKAWSFTIEGNLSQIVNDTLYDRLINCSQDSDGITGIPLEIFLYYYGVYPVTSVSFGGTTYNWTNVALSADQDRVVLVTENGSIYFNGNVTRVGNVDAGVTARPGVSTLDIKPSISYALGIDKTRSGIVPSEERQVVLVYIDAFGYQRYENSLHEGLIANISSLGEPIKAICEYPSVSQVNAKAMVTGLPADLVKGDFRSYNPSGETVLDVINDQGKKAEWVDGITAPVSVNSTIYNMDANGNGTEDDEAMDAAVKEYRKGAGLIVVHLDDTDSSMHRYGPYSPQGKASVKLADALVGEMMSNMSTGTVLIVWADHGCHQSGNAGDHGTLLPDDMYIPIFVRRF